MLKLVPEEMNFPIDSMAFTPPSEDESRRHMTPFVPMSNVQVLNGDMSLPSSSLQLSAMQSKVGNIDLPSMPKLNSSIGAGSVSKYELPPGFKKPGTVLGTIEKGVATGNVSFQQLGEQSTPNFNEASLAEGGFGAQNSSVPNLQNFGGRLSSGLPPNVAMPNIVDMNGMATQAIGLSSGLPSASQGNLPNVNGMATQAIDHISSFDISRKNFTPIPGSGPSTPMLGASPIHHRSISRGKRFSTISLVSTLGLGPKQTNRDDSDDGGGWSTGEDSEDEGDDFSDEEEKPPGKQTDAQKLEDLQAQAIFSLVEDVPIVGRNGPSVAKLLFLTNRQGRLIDFADLDKFTQAMDIHPKPKLVMNFMPSFSSHSKVQSNYNHWKYQGKKIGYGHGYVTAAKKDDLDATDRRIGVFLREVR